MRKAGDGEAVEEAGRCLFGPQVELEGVTRSSEKRSSFVPDNSPAKGEWFWVDVPALAANANLPPETPLVEVGHIVKHGTGTPNAFNVYTSHLMACDSHQRATRTHL